jgi:hypothetical protein
MSIDVNVTNDLVIVTETTEDIVVNVSNAAGPQGPAGANGVGVPIGGTTNQVLKKLSGTNYDTYWAVDGVGVPYSGATGDVNLGAFNLTATSIIKSGGTSSQFLKADGSVDSTTYTPSTRNITINGTTQDLSADRTFSVGTVTSLTLATGTTGTDVNVSNGTITTSGTITLNIPDASATARGLITTGTQTIAGAKTFSSSPTVPSLYLSNMTAGSGALYYSTGENRLTLANYNASGILMFEVNGGVYAMTLNADLTARFNGYTTNGFVKFGSSNGTLVVDTTTYQPLLTNPVTGTGTTNFLPKWTSGTAIGNSLVYDNGTQIGLGTTTPLGLLHLYQSAATTRMVMDGDAGRSKIITFRTNGLQRFGMYVNNTAESGLNVGSDFQVRAYSDAGTLLSTPLFIKRSTGNVGIGTTSPLSLLNVQSASNTNLSLTYTVNSGANFTQISGGSINLVNKWATIQFKQDASENAHHITFATASPSTDTTERMRLTSNGRLLLGTSVESTFLADINGTARVSSDVTFGNDINLTRATSPAIVSTTNQNIRFVTNGFTSNFTTSGVLNAPTALRTDGVVQTVNLAVGGTFYNNTPPTNGAIIQGNLLVGTTTDSGEKLQVNGTARVTGSTYLATSSGSVGIGVLTPLNLLQVNTYYNQTLGAGTPPLMVSSTASVNQGALFISTAVGTVVNANKDALNLVYFKNGAINGGSANINFDVYDGGNGLDKGIVARITGGQTDGVNTVGDGFLSFSTASSLSSTPTERLRIISSGAATFSSSVTATSFIKSGGTSAQILAADGSVITAGTNITISGGTISSSGGGGGSIDELQVALISQVYG